MAVIGTIIANKYEILKLIGKGGMSEVYLAIDQNLSKQWAVKEIKKRAWDKNNQIVIQSAIAEANMIKKLDHPCLPRIVDIIDREDVIFIVMDYIEGETLKRVIDREGAQDQEQVLKWALSLCDVLMYLHSQDPPIIYRDMKPANIMLQPNGNIKLIDFGIAREYKEQSIEDTVSLGTKGYAAPEQFGGHGQTDVRTDIYCLGVTLYHLVTGKNPAEPPYEMYPIRHWNGRLSAGLEKIIQKCTQADPNERYQSDAELKYALLHYEEEDDEFRRSLKKQLNKFLLLSGVAVFFLCAGLLCLFLKNNTKDQLYERLIEQAQRTTNYGQQKQFYEEAIAVRPGLIQGYEGLINLYKSDLSFSIEEESNLKMLINQYASEIRQADGYGELAYDIGKLYWYYYDYGADENYDNDVTRMKSAISWFDDACIYGSEEDDFYQTAYVYREIGIFNRDITLLVEEAEDQNVYGDYFLNLNNLLTEEKSESELVELEICRLGLFAIENYAYKFQREGISRSQVEMMLNNIIDRIDGIYAVTEKTEALKEELEERISSAENAVENAYEL